MKMKNKALLLTQVLILSLNPLNLLSSTHEPGNIFQDSQTVKKNSFLRNCLCEENRNSVSSQISYCFIYNPFSFRVAVS